MSILSTNTKLIKVGQDYSAGSGISIDDHVISVTGEFGKTYSAGDNIDIYKQGEQLYISSKDWTNDIANASANAYNEAVAKIPDPFDPTFISAKVDNKLDTTAFTNWQNGQYSTDLQTIEGQIANKQDSLTFAHGTSSGSISSINGSAIVDDYTYHMLNVTRVATANLYRTITANSGNWNTVTNKLDSTAFSNVSGDFLTAHQSLDGYAKEQWVEDKGYLTGVSIPESAVWQDVSTTVQSNSANWAGGSSDTFYIYPGKTTDKEISENSGKDLKLYNSANNVFLDFAGKSTLSKYTMFSFKEITGTQANQNTVQHLRLRVYPNATSACKVYDTNTVNLLDSNSTVSTAQTAYYDGDGNSLTQTHSELTALNSFVQSNSANWGGGSSTASDTVIFRKNTYQPSHGGKSVTDSYVSNVSDLYFEACVYSNVSAPTNIIIEQNGSFVGEAYWTQVSSDGGYNYYSASFNGQPNSDYKLNNNGYDSYNWCHVYAKGIRTEAFNQAQYNCSTNDTVKINVPGTINGMNQGMATSLTSINYGILEDFTTKGYEQYNCDISPENYDNDCSFSLSAEFEVGGGGVTGEFVPQSAFYELKQSYDALSSLFATYSGQWLLPNEGV